MSYAKEQFFMVVGKTGDQVWDRFIHLGSLLLATLSSFAVPFFSDKVFVMTNICWAASFVLAMAWIWITPDEEFKRSKALVSVGKLLTWWAVLAIAFGLRQMDYLALTTGAAILESAILLTEVGTVLKRLGMLWPNHPVGRVLAHLAMRVEERANQPEKEEA